MKSTHTSVNQSRTTKMYPTGLEVAFGSDPMNVHGYFFEIREPDANSTNDDLVFSIDTRTGIEVNELPLPFVSPGKIKRGRIWFLGGVLKACAHYNLNIEPDIDQFLVDATMAMSE